MGKIYTFDETFDGLLSCVFAAYFEKNFPDEIKGDNNFQRDFLSEYIKIETNRERAERVRQGIIKTASFRAYYVAYTAFMSDIPEIYTAIFKFIVLAFEHGKRVFNLLKNDSVLQTEKASYRATHEADKLKGFLRFSEMQGGIMYGEIEPSCNVLEILAHHFADRFPLMPFVIRDKKREISAIYKGEIVLTELPLNNLPPLSDNETEYQRLWKQFIKSVNIKERENPKCQMTLMPKKYWKNITEMQKG